MDDILDAVTYITKLQKDLRQHDSELRQLAHLLSSGQITVDRRISGTLFMPQLQEVFGILQLKETWSSMEIITVIKEVFSMTREDLRRR